MSHTALSSSLVPELVILESEIVLGPLAGLCHSPVRAGYRRSILKAVRRQKTGAEVGSAIGPV